jgi:hypothetical protein
MVDKEKIDLLEKFTNYIYYNVNFSSDVGDKPWYSEELDVELTSKELVEFYIKRNENLII